MLDFFSKDPSKIIERCNKLRLEGKYDKAEQILRKNIKNSKNDYLFLIELARVQFEKKKTIDAMASLKSAYYLQFDKIDTIIDVAEDMHYRSDQKYHTGKLLLELLAKKRKADDLHKILKTISANDIKKIGTEYLKKFKTIQKERNINQLTKKDNEIFILSGIIFLNIKDFINAQLAFTFVFKNQVNDRNFILQEYMEITKYNYSDPEPFIALGDFYMIIGDKDKAINYFQKAIKLNPELKESIAEKLDGIVSDSDDISETGKLSLADVYMNKGDFIKSIDILNNVLSSKSTNTEGIIKRAKHILVKNENNIDANKVLVKALLIGKNFPSAIVSLKNIFDIDKNENDYILENIEKIESADFSSNEKDILKAEIHLSKGNVNESAKIVSDLYSRDSSASYDIENIINEILEKDKEHITALTLLISIYSDSGQLPKAKTLLDYIVSIEDEKCIEVGKHYYEVLSEKFPDDTELKISLTIVYIKKGDISKATTLTAEIINKDPNAFYEIVPNMFESASSDENIAKEILNILDSMDGSQIDPYLYEYTIAEISYLAGNIEKSLDKTLKLIEHFPDKETNTLEIIDRMDEKYPSNKHIKEFQFNFYIHKKDFDNALIAVMVLYENKDMIGHVLDDLYILHKNVPDNYNVMVNILKVLDEMEMYEKIITEAKSFINRIPQENSGIIRFFIGKAYAKKGQVNDASTYIFQAITLDSFIVSDAIILLKDLLNIDFSSIKLHYSLAQAYHKNNMTDMAIDELMEIFKLDGEQTEIIIRDLESFYETTKTNPKLLFALGKLYMKLIKYDKGVVYLTEAYELDDSYVDPVLNLLKTIQESENIESGEILYSMGLLYSKKKMFKMASDHLYNAMSIETKLKEQVINKLQMIINLQPEEIYARYSLSQVYIDMHNYIQAIQLLRQIETINPAESKNIIEYYLGVIAEEPNNTPLLLSLGDSYLAIGIDDKSIESFRKAISLDKSLTDVIIDKLNDYPNKSIEIQFFLSEIFKDKGDYESAVNWLNSIYLSDIEQYDTIKKHINDILLQSPEQQNALMLLSNIYYNNEDYDNLISLSFDIFEKSSIQETKFRSGMLLTQAYRKSGKENEAENIISKMMKENRMLYFTILLQFYEQEKSTRTFKLKSRLDKDSDNLSLRIEYAASLIIQNNFDAAKNMLIFKTDNMEIEFERVFYLAKIGEMNNNIVFALQIASKLRHSKNTKHISYLIKLLRKMGYHGEIDSILKEHPDYTVSMNKYNLSKHVFSEYKILT